ncbi:hypothetical protein BCR33DRAFT_344027 [Rhizoclosmatium globosum]|uniref:Methyltransferase domain-containing protein n=1 Tax=Rhizoclosmatium globosum TaxID=329046 RepID=A0A1Y2C2Q3_9FUNG|nr:hypothetical protein BCR33DRAFT_344027 [Rhizoclosmatium globosum]|eukprot:ORY41310.1 hypothetical protein BCR33DRAFT_344027 [Rhizoclosmatium globosum]
MVENKCIGYPHRKTVFNAVQCVNLSRLSYSNSFLQTSSTYGMNTEIVYAKPQPSKKLRSKLIALAVAIPTLFLLCAIGFYFKRPLTPTGLQGFTLKQLFSGFTVETWALDRMNQMLEVWNDFDKLTPDEASKYNGLNLLALFPETYQCDRNYFQKIGGHWSCGEFFRPLPSGCTSVSLGSNSGFVSNFGCTIYTFDCKRNPSESLNTRIYPWCFDEAGQLDKIHKTWHNAMDELGIVQVDYLKIDLNGDEWTTLPILINEWNIQI